MGTRSRRSAKRGSLARKKQEPGRSVRSESDPPSRVLMAMSHSGASLLMLVWGAAGVSKVLTTMQMFALPNSSCAQPPRETRDCWFQIELRSSLFRVQLPNNQQSIPVSPTAAPRPRPRVPCRTPLTLIPTVHCSGRSSLVPIFSAGEFCILGHRG